MTPIYDVVDMKITANEAVLTISDEPVDERPLELRLVDLLASHGVSSQSLVDQLKALIEYELDGEWNKGFESGADGRDEW